jgi:hypothetical protein
MSYELVIRSTDRTVDLLADDGRRTRAWLWEGTLPDGKRADVYVVAVDSGEIRPTPGLFGPGIQVVEPEEIG